MKLEICQKIGNKKMINLCVVFISLLIFGCENKLEKKTQFYNNENRNLQDSIINGEVVTYYKNGNLREKASYKDGLLEGEYKTYYPSGNPEKLLSYTEGKKKLGFYEYYDVIDTFIAKQNNEYRIFTEPLIKKYGFFNSNEDVVFELLYDKKGEVINKFGTLIVEYYQPIELNDKGLAEFQFLIPNPPKAFLEFVIIDKRKFDKVIFSQKIKKNEVLVEYQHRFTDGEEKTYEWQAISTIYNEKKGFLFSDTLLLYGSNSAKMK